jgi:hypothetical protein
MLEILDMSRLSIVPGSIMPRLYETLDVPFPDKLVQMHFLRENGDWFAVEYDPEQRIFYGYIDVRPGTPHWGYFSFDEVVDCWIPSLCSEPEMDLDWMPRKTKEIPDILGGE